MAVLLLHQSSSGKLLHDRAKEIRSRGQIKKVVAVSGMVVVELLQSCLQLRVNILVVELGSDVIQAAREPLPDIGIDVAAGVTAAILPQIDEKDHNCQERQIEPQDCAC